jgi:hypothetical protein
VVDGTTSTTESVYMVSETVHLYNPSNGWLQNCNSTPYSAGPESPKEEKLFTWRLTEKVLGINAVRLLSKGENTP